MRCISTTNLALFTAILLSRLCCVSQPGEKLAMTCCLESTCTIICLIVTIIRKIFKVILSCCLKCVQFQKENLENWDNGINSINSTFLVKMFWICAHAFMIAFYAYDTFLHMLWIACYLARKELTSS